MLSSLILQKRHNWLNKMNITIQFLFSHSEKRTSPFKESLNSRELPIALSVQPRCYNLPTYLKKLVSVELNLQNSGGIKRCVVLFKRMEPLFYFRLSTMQCRNITTQWNHADGKIYTWIPKTNLCIKIKYLPPSRTGYWVFTVAGVYLYLKLLIYLLDYLSLHLHCAHIQQNINIR